MVSPTPTVTTPDFEATIFGGIKAAPRHTAAKLHARRNPVFVAEATQTLAELTTFNDPRLGAAAREGHQVLTGGYQGVPGFNIEPLPNAPKTGVVAKTNTKPRIPGGSTPVM